jgi:hypothetical protein
LNEWRICLNSDAFVHTVFGDRGVLNPRMKFYLVDNGDRLW